MPEIYASNEVTAELLDPVSGSVITSVSIPYRRDLTISERPVYAQRGYHRSNTLSAAHLRSLGSVSIRKDADSLALAAEIKRWQKGVTFYALSSDLKGKRYRHPHLRVTFANADGSTDVVTAYAVKVSDRSLSAPDGGIVGDTTSLDVLGGFEPKEGGYEPVRALDFARTGTATYLSTAGTLTTAGDGVARIGLPGAVRRNLLNQSENLETWNQTNAGVGINQKVASISGVGDVFFDKATAQSTGGFIRNTSITVGNVLGRTFTFSFWVVADSSQPIEYRISDGVTESSAYLTATASATPQRVSITHTFASGTNTTVQVFIYPGTRTGTGTVYVYGAQLELSSSASAYQPTNATGVDLTHPLNGAGLVLEGVGVNLVANGDCETANPTLGGTGFAVYGTASLSSDTFSSAGWPRKGSKSLKMVGDATNGSRWRLGNASAMNGLTAGRTYTFSADVYTQSGVDLSTVYITVLYNDGTLKQEFSNKPVATGHGSLSLTVSLPAATTLCYAELRCTNPSATVYWDIIQVEESPFRTSFMDGTRQPDLCGIVPLQNELSHSHDLSNPAWQFTGSGSAQPTKSGADNTVSFSGAPTTYWQDVTPAAIPGTTRTAAITLKAGTLSGSFVLRLLDQSSGLISQTTVNTADLHATDARTFYVTGTPGASVTGLKVLLKGNSGTGTVIVESLRLVKGSHPGTYVKTTDTPIPAPVSPALDPAWQQNGRVSFRALWPTITATDAVNRVVFGDQGATLRLAQYNGTLLYAHRKDSSGTARLLSYSNAALVKDGAPHDVELEWTNEINEQTGVREMWQRLYIDGVLVASQDVAALYGATAWAEIDPSRLISDGNVFAVISELVTEYPTPRAGYRPA